MSELLTLSEKATPGLLSVSGVRRRYDEPSCVIVDAASCVGLFAFSTGINQGASREALADAKFLVGLWPAFRSGRLIEAHASDTGVSGGLSGSASDPTPDLGAQGEPVAWIAPHSLCDASGFIDARIDREGEFTLPLFKQAPAAPRTGSGVSVEGIEQAIADEKALEDDIVLLMVRGWIEVSGGDGSVVESVDHFAKFSPEDYAACQKVARAVLALLQAPRTGETGAQTKLADGCCSATSLCAHQKKDPTTICGTCQRAAADRDFDEDLMPGGFN